MLLQIVRGPFPPILPCELFFGQPSIKGADAYKFHKQYIGRDLDGMELPKWVFLVARMDMKNITPGGVLGVDKRNNDVMM